jgi:hypothetical protein
MKLYSLARAAEMEETEEWKQRLEKATQRSVRSAAVAERKRTDLLAEVNALDIQIPTLAPAKLGELAVAHRNERSDEKTSPDSVEPATLSRWKVNYLRHECSRYEEALDGLYGRTGRLEATQAVREVVYEAIAKAYPDLAHEARRQCDERRRLAE